MARESYGLIVKLTNNRGLYARNSFSSRVWMAPDVNPTENLKLPITEWEQSLAFDTAAECETFIAMRWVKAEKENRESKLERYRCVPADVVYPHMTPRK